MVCCSCCCPSTNNVVLYPTTKFLLLLDIDEASCRYPMIIKIEQAITTRRNLLIILSKSHLHFKGCLQWSVWYICVCKGATDDDGLLCDVATADQHCQQNEHWTTDPCNSCIVGLISLQSSRQYVYHQQALLWGCLPCWLGLSSPY